MAPEPARVHVAYPRLPAVRQEPNLRGHGVQAIPLEDAQHGQPELAPTRYHRRPPVNQYPLPCPHALRVIGVHAEQPHRDVRENRAEHRGVALDVQAVPPVRVLLVLQVPHHLSLPVGTQDRFHRLSDVTRDDQSGHQEHGTAVVPRPVAVVHLELLVELEAAQHPAVEVRPVHRGLCVGLALPLGLDADHLLVPRAALLHPHELVCAVPYSELLPLPDILGPGLVVCDPLVLFPFVDLLDVLPDLPPRESA
mmetsp:Transcript_9534/g.27122  ORF Transcript_9534/g.27122 Transcript_9534/m.27122 type:complete len:252 (-) Transcript_9534:38-793(-)